MLKITTRFTCGILVILMSSLTPVPGALAVSGALIIYVDDDAPPAGDGLAWVTAFRFLQDASSFASDPLNGVTEIRVAQGLYLPDRNELFPTGTGDRFTSFSLTDGILLVGGFAGLGQPDPDAQDVALYETILSGDLNGDDLPGFINIGDNSIHVVMMLNAEGMLTIDGFSIVSGHADSLSHFIGTSGAGLTFFLALPPVITPQLQIVNCRFRSNLATTGAGAYIRGNVDVVLTNCTFEDNLGLWYGGGLASSQAAMTMAGCLFENNESKNFGGAMRVSRGSTLIDSCEFVGNIGKRGGALAGDGLNGTSIEISNTLFGGNLAILGGAIFAEDISVTMLQSTLMLNSSDSGGAIAMFNSTLDLQMSSLSANTATTGGGLYLDQSPPASLADCSFDLNSATFEGGAIAAFTTDVVASASTFSGNRGESGGALFIDGASLTINGCDFLGNEAESSGGALKANNNITTSIWDSIFHDNRTTIFNGGGGAVSCSFGFLNVVRSSFEHNSAIGNGGGIQLSVVTGGEIVLSEFIENQASSNGGGVLAFASTLRMDGCLLAGNNVVGFNGGGVYLGLSSNANIFGSTIVGNQAGISGPNVFISGNSSLLMTDSIISGNIDGPAEVNYSCVLGGWAGVGSNNISLDPLFVDPDGLDNDASTFGDNDYHLSSSSPCIDAGNNSLIPPDEFDLDQDGNMLESLPHDLDAGPRVRNASVDMGAYESDFCTADFSGDGQVNVTDLLSLLGAWGMCQSPCAVDTNGDGQVNVTDLLVLLAGWGACP